MLLYSCNRNDPLVGVLQMTARIFGFHGSSLQHNDACDDLEAVGNSMLELDK